MTDDRAALAARHQPDVREMADIIVGPRCRACGQFWGDKGCDTARALALPPDSEYLSVAIDRAMHVDEEHGFPPGYGEDSLAFDIIANWPR